MAQTVGDYGAALRAQVPAAPARPAPQLQSAGEVARVVLICSALVVAWWRLPALILRPAGDYGWMYGLHQARVDGLRFGSEVVFTYGPLAFLAFPSSSSRVELALAVACWFALAVCFLATLQISFRTTTSSAWAWLATAAIAATLAIQPAPAYAVAAMGMVTSLLYVTRMLPVPARAAFPWLAGVVLATFLLIKFSSAVPAGLCAAAAIAALPEHRRFRLGAFGLAGVVGLLALWLTSQGDLAHLLGYLRYSLEFSAGYSSAMGFEWPGLEHEYAIAGLVALGLLVALAGRRRTHVPWLFTGVLAVVLWGAFKQGFVRHDGHSAYFFAIAAALSFAFAVLQRSASLAVVGGLSLLAQASTIGHGVAHFDPARGLRSFTRIVTMLARDSVRRSTNQVARQELRKALNLSPALLEAIGRRSVYVEPFDEQVAWAYRLAWRPLPTLQSYAAYTPALDELNSEAVRDGRAAPQAILRRHAQVPLDGRYMLWDPPRTQLEVLCRYRVAAHEGEWLVLTRSGDRCGAKRSLARGQYAANRVIQVPQVENGIVLATVHPETDLVHALAGFLFKPPNLVLQVDGSQRRLPWGHVVAPLVLSVTGSGESHLGAPVTAKELRIPYPATIEFDVVPLAP